MKHGSIVRRRPAMLAVLALLVGGAALPFVDAQDVQPSQEAKARPPLPPVPAPLGVPKPAPATDAPYAPQPILQGGIVLTLYPPDSPYLRKEKIRDAERYNLSRDVAGRIESIVSIHNPSIEV